MRKLTYRGYISVISLSTALQLAACSPTFSVDPPPPPAEVHCTLPSYAPPALPQGGPVPFYEASAFLFTPPAASGEYQPSPVQVGVMPGTILRDQIARVTGRTLTPAGEPLPCVKVTLVGNAQYGYTLSRDDGNIDLAVNSGSYTVRYELDGYLPVQRQLYAPTLDWIALPDVVMTPVSGPAIVVDFGAGQWQVARGERSADSSGGRQVTLLFPPGTQASIRRLDGSTRPVDKLHIRTSEYTVGPRGPQAMPGDLPVNSGYTYAVELTADEVLSDPQAIGIEFDRPVSAYVDSFLAFPVGSVVPVGYYDARAKDWTPADNGRVVQFLGVMDGMAQLDVTGRNKPASPDSRAQLGITDDELRTLADPALYQPGQTLWRTPLRHFTPYDLNWPIAPPPDAVAPTTREPTNDQQQFRGVCQQNGTDVQPVVTLDEHTTIDCDSQTIRYRVPVDGITADLGLVYTNRRVSAYTSSASLLVTLWSPGALPLPPSLRSVLLDINVAGRSTQYTFNPSDFKNDWVVPFEWDGMDRDRRNWLDQAPVSATIRFRYDAYYYPTFNDSYPQFNRFPSPISISGVWAGDRVQFDISRTWNNGLFLYRPRTEDAGLGGFVPSVQHRYLEKLGQLELGDGRLLSKQDSQTQLGLTIERYVGTDDRQPGNMDGPLAVARLKMPTGLFLSTNSSPKYLGLFVADYGNCQIRQITDSGVTTFAGLGITGDCTTADIKNNVAKLDGALGGANSAILGPDGNLYIASPTRRVVHVVNLNEAKLPKDYLFTVAGNGTAGGGSGADASKVGIGNAAGLALGSSLHDKTRSTRTLYISGTRDTVSAVIQRVDIPIQQDKPDRWVTSVPATNDGIVVSGSAGSQYTALAFNEDFHDPAAPKHILYALDTGKSQVWRHTITPDSKDPSLDHVDSVLIAGTGTAGWSGDGPDATTVALNHPRGMSLSSKGDILYIADTGNHIVRRISGVNQDGAKRSVLTIAGDAKRGSGTGCTAKRDFAGNVLLGDPEGVWATDSVLYVSDSKNHSICKLKPEDGFVDGDLLVIAHDDTLQKASWLYYFRRTFGSQSNAVPGEHVRTRRGELANRDPGKAPIEYDFAYTTAGGQRVLSEIQGNDLKNGTSFTLGMTYNAGSVVLQEATSKKQTVLTLSPDNLVSDIKGMDSGNSFHLDYVPAVTEDAGHGKKGLMMKATDAVKNSTQSFAYDASGRLKVSGNYKLVTRTR